MKFTSKMVARAGILIAVSIALGWLTLTIPNVELITASIFLSGFWCGPLWGIIIGIVSEGIFSLTNPVGMPLPPLLFAQCLGMAFVGLAGGWVGLRWQKRIPRLFPVVLGAIGLILTVIFDSLTTLSFPIASGLPLSEIWKVLIMGIPFVVIHWASNTAIFILIVPLIIKRLPAIRTNLRFAAIIGLILVSHLSAKAQDSEPIPPDSQEVIIPDSLTIDSLTTDSLVLSSIVLDTLPPIEKIFTSESEIDTLCLNKRLGRVAFLEPGIEDVSDVIRYFPYAYPYDLATFGAYAGMSIHGQSPRRSQYVLDGRSLNHRRNGMVDLNEITVEEMSDIFANPLDTRSDPPSTGGTIGFRSYLPMSDIPFSRVALRAGYYGFTTVDFHVSQKVYGNWYTNIVGQVGYFEDRGDNTELESVNFRSHITHRPTPLWSGRLSYYHYRSKSDITFPVGHHKSVRNDLVLSLARRLNPSKEPRLELQSWLTDIHQNDLNIFREGERRLGSQIRAVAPICSTGSWWVGIFGEGWEIESGDDPSHSDAEFRAFGGVSIPIITGVSAQSSLLYSLYDSGPKEPSGKASIKIQPIHWVSLHGGAEWAFRAPSYFEEFGHGRLDLRNDLVEPQLQYAHLDTLLPAADISPERSQTFSGGIDLLLPWSLRLSFGAYRKELTDPIVFRSVSEGYIRAENGSKTTWQGGSITGLWAIWDSLEISGSLSINDAVDDPDHFVPDKNGWAALTYHHAYFQGDLRMVGRIEGVYWDERILTRHLRSYLVPEASVINFRISATIKDVTLFWGMNNIYPARYELIGGFPMIHREEIYGVRWNFLD